MQDSWLALDKREIKEHKLSVEVEDWENIILA